MRDYTKMPEYRHLTPLDAQHHYARDLLKKQCDTCDGCRNCGFPELMGTSHEELRLSGCCGWLVDGNPEKAIRVLENLLGITYEPEYDSPWTIKAMAAHNGLHDALELMQEECAELVQAISKRRRAATRDRENAMDHIIEEMADVSIMLDELCALIPCGADRLKRWRDEKVARTLNRYDLRVQTETEKQVWEVAMKELDALTEQEQEQDTKDSAEEIILAINTGITRMENAGESPRVLHVRPEVHDLLAGTPYLLRNNDGTETALIGGYRLKVVTEQELFDNQMSIETKRGV